MNCVNRRGAGLKREARNEKFETISKARNSNDQKAQDRGTGNQVGYEGQGVRLKMDRGKVGIRSPGCPIGVGHDTGGARVGIVDPSFHSG